MAGGVLVTGASSGIGRASALELDRRGFRVFGGVRSEPDAEALQREGSARLTPLMLDVTDADAISRAREEVERELGGEPLAGVVNNAGVGMGGPLETVGIDDVRHQFEVNTIAPLAVTQAFIPALRESRGRVVNMSSVGGRVAEPMLGPYSASKFALEALSDAMRRELRRFGILVVLVEPGNIKTQIWEKGRSQVEQARARLSPEQLERYGRNLDRMERITKLADRTGAKPEKVACVVAHALTADRPRARYLVGGDARVQLAIDRALPTRAVDALITRFAGG